MSYVTSSYLKQKIRKTFTGRIYNYMFSGKGLIKTLFRKTFHAPIYNGMNTRFEERIYFDLIKNRVNLSMADLGANECSFRSKKIRENIKKQKYVRIDIDKETNPDIVADLNHKLNIKSNSFDIIFNVSLLEHLYNPQKCIDEMYRILKKGGAAYILVPFMYRQHGAPLDYFRFTPFAIRHLFRKFKKVDIDPMGGYISLYAQHFYLGTYILDIILFLGFFLRVITYPFWKLVVMIDKYDKYKLTAIYYTVKIFK